MPRLLLVLESARATAMQRLSASMATMATTRTNARLTATTVLTTLWGACSSAPARGSMVFTDVVFMAVATTAEATTVAGTTDGLASVAADAALKDAAASTVAVIVASAAVVAFAATVVSEGAPAVSTAVAVREAARAVSRAAGVPTVVGVLTVAVATAADTGKTSKFLFEQRNGWQNPLPAVFIFGELESWNPVSYCTGRVS
jgi:hypothetical protein